MPFNLFRTVVYHYQHVANRNATKDMEFASRTEFEATKPDLLTAGIRSQGSEYRERSSKAALCARADDIRKWLEDPKLSTDHQRTITRPIKDDISRKNSFPLKNKLTVATSSLKQFISQMI